MSVEIPIELDIFWTPRSILGKDKKRLNMAKDTYGLPTGHDTLFLGPIGAIDIHCSTSRYSGRRRINGSCDIWATVRLLEMPDLDRENRAFQAVSFTLYPCKASSPRDGVCFSCHGGELCDYRQFRDIANRMIIQFDKMFVEPEEA